MNQVFESNRKSARLLNHDNAETVSECPTIVPVRKFGRLKGRIHIADDFDETPAEFREYI